MQLLRMLFAAIREDSVLHLGLHVSTVITARSQDALSQNVMHDQQFEIQYSLDVTLHSLTSSLLTHVKSYLWRVLYYPQGTHPRLLDDLWK